MLITARHLDLAFASGQNRLDIAPGDIVTPAARDRARELGIVLGSDDSTTPSAGRATIPVRVTDATGPHAASPLPPARPPSGAAAAAAPPSDAAEEADDDPYAGAFGLAGQGWRRETTAEVIHVCRGTWCTLDGSPEVLKAFRAAVAAQGLKARVRVRGMPCMALCQAGPVVKVLPDNIRYWDVGSENVDAIVAQHFDTRKPVPPMPTNPDPPGVETGPLLRGGRHLRGVPPIVAATIARVGGTT